MAIPSHWNLVEKGLYDSKNSVLVVADLHLDRRIQTEPYPKMEHEQIEDRLNKLLNKTNADELILNGDVYSHYPPDEQGIEMFHRLDDEVDKITFILGNHEENAGGYPESIVSNFEVSEFVERNEMLVHHGHNDPSSEDAKYRVIGHIHPVHKGQNVFLWGENAYKEQSVLILPGFSKTLSGSNITEMEATSHCPVLEEGEDIGDYDMIFCRE